MKKAGQKPALKRALEDAGIEFTNGDGVKLRKSR
jgi:hypothetical protein